MSLCVMVKVLQIYDIAETMMEIFSSWLSWLWSDDSYCTSSAELCQAQHSYRISVKITGQIHTGATFLKKTWKCHGLSSCQGIDQMSGENLGQGKLSIAYFKFGTTSVFIRLFWLYISILKRYFCLLSHFSTLTVTSVLHWVAQTKICVWNEMSDRTWVRVPGRIREMSGNFTVPVWRVVTCYVTFTSSLVMVGGSSLDIFVVRIALHKLDRPNMVQKCVHTKIQRNSLKRYMYY